ncbi:MAG: outer membrane beta-barrel protein [Reichenbachiella sp.]
MKKLHLSLTAIFFLSFTLSAQNYIEVSGYGGYMLSGTADFYGYIGNTNQYVSGEVNVDDGPVYGATLGYEVSDAGMQIQFLYGYNKVNSTIRYFGSFAPEAEVVELKIEHFHLGAERSLGGNEKVNPYAGVSLGITNYAPQNSVYDNTVRFSGSVGAGLKVYPTDRIGLKFQARMFLPMTFSGIGIYCGTGGCGGGSTFNVPIVHGEFTGGVVFRIEK